MDEDRALWFPALVAGVVGAALACASWWIGWHVVESL